jgi:RecJ-like exonuclease
MHLVVAEQLDGEHREELRFRLKALCDERRAPARVVAVARSIERVEALSDRVAELDGDVLEQLDLDA